MKRDRIRSQAEKRAVNRLLDILLPSDSSVKTPQWRRTRTKLRVTLKEGRLDERKLEISIANWDDPKVLEYKTRFDSRLNEYWRQSENVGIDDPNFDRNWQRFLEWSKRVEKELRDELDFRDPLRKILSVKEVMGILVVEESERIKAMSLEMEENKQLVIPPEGIIVAQNSLLELLARDPTVMYTIGHREFEKVVYELFRKLGYWVQLTASTRDGGCDLIAFTEDEVGIKTQYVVEAKHYRPENRVGVSIVRELSAVRQKYGAHHGILVTSSSFTRDAVKENTAYYGLHLSDYDRLLEWIRKTRN